jgi:hypothetical protein
MQPWLVYCKFIYELFWRYEFSKITNRIGKKLLQSSRTYAVKWQFLAKNPTFRLDGLIRYSTTKHAVHSYLTGFRLWRQYWRQYWGFIFFGGIYPSKIGHIAPFLATIQALSRARAFLLG